MVVEGSTKKHFKFHQYEAKSDEKEILHLKYQEMDPIQLYLTRSEKAIDINNQTKEKITKILVPHTTTK